MPRSGSGGAAPRTAHDLARQRRDTSAARAALFPGEEVAATSQDLAALGTRASPPRRHRKGQPAPISWKARQFAILEQLKKPKAQLLLIPAPAVQKLIEAAAAGGGCSTPKLRPESRRRNGCLFRFGGLVVADAAANHE